MAMILFFERINGKVIFEKRLTGEYENAIMQIGATRMLDRRLAPWGKYDEYFLIRR